jgi:U2-associated protein SR140
MADKDHLKEFPDVIEKLSAPKKLSAFEKERLAAEEKRRREQAETAAALREFEDSFGQDDDDDDFDGFPASARGPGAARGGDRGGGGYAYDRAASRGGYGGAARSGPGSLGPPPSLKRKRALDELREQQEIRREQQAFENEYSLGRGSRREGPTALQQSREDQGEEEVDGEDVAPRPTVQLSSLPPDTTEAQVRLMLNGLLKVHSVFVQTVYGPAKLSMSAVAALDYDTSTSQIDSAVSALRDRYLGCGYRLSISRHLSSTALQPGAPLATSASVEPFGAERINREHPRGGYSMRNAPPPSEFAPPDSYGGPARRAGPQAFATVVVQPPADIGLIRAIHVLAERLLSEPDPQQALEIEAALMATPSVQKDERFAFLFDSQSPAGVYYRYLLWNDDDDFQIIQEQKRVGRAPERIFGDIPIDWNIPQGEVPFADLSRLGDVLDHLNYVSSDEDSDDGEERRYYNRGRQEGEGPAVHSDRKHLTPLQLAKFAWLLSRMPSSQAKLRLADVAAVSHFAIHNAGAGAEEIVDMLVLNVEKPFSLTQCATFDREDPSQEDEDMYEPDEKLPSIEAAPAADGFVKKEQDTDPSQMKLVALYLINDVLHNSSTAGVRNAWKYRQLFETAFRCQKTFRNLGALGKELGWGRMKEEQWRNKIRVLFEIWEHNSVFATDVFDALKRDFFEQPSEEVETGHPDRKGRAPSALGPKHLAKFKRVDGTASPAPSVSPAPGSRPTALEGTPLEVLDRVSGAPLEDVDGTPLDDVDGAPLDDDDGAPMDDVEAVLPDHVPMNGVDDPSPAAPDTDHHTSMEIDPPIEMQPLEKVPATTGFSLKASVPSKSALLETQRKRPAEDMFADSDEE